MNYSAHNQGILRSLILFFPNTTHDEIKFPTKAPSHPGPLVARWRQIIRAASVEEIRLISSYLTAASPPLFCPHIIYWSTGRVLAQAADTPTPGIRI